MGLSLTHTLTMRPMMLVPLVLPTIAAVKCKQSKSTEHEVSHRQVDVALGGRTNSVAVDQPSVTLTA